MKKRISFFMAAILLCSSAVLTGCKQESSGNDSNQQSSKVILQSDESSGLSSEETSQENSNGSEPKNEMEQIIEDYGFEGMAYAVKNGEVVLSFGEGTLEHDEPITVDMPMPIASVSKQFCAAAILKLRDEGKLSLDDTLDKYYPEYEAGSKIPLKLMLEMRSGIPNYENELETDYVSPDKTAEENEALTLKWIFSKPLDFDPDTGCIYSNSNYFLLGCIVEKVSGQKYEDYIRENIFKPLGMKNTGFISELDAKPDWGKGLTYNIKVSKTGIAKGAGDIVSNGPDMALWMKGLSNGSIISEESFKEMCTDYSSQNGYHYGYALFVDYYGGVSHSGHHSEGYIAYDYINKDKDVQIFLATNTVGLAETERLMLKLSEELSK